jgi:hypothetical protein
MEEVRLKRSLAHVVPLNFSTIRLKQLLAESKMDCLGLI